MNTISEPPKPAKQPTDYEWVTPWPAWSLAFKTRRSFGMAAAFGGISLVLQIALGLIMAAGGIVTSSIRHIMPELFGLVELFTVIMVLTIPVAAYTFLVIYIASRFMDPNTWLFGGFGNLRVFRTLFLSFMLSLVLIGMIALVAYLIQDNSFLRYGRARDMTQLIPMIALTLPVVLIYQALALVVTRLCLRWPDALADQRTSLWGMLSQRRSLIALFLLGLSIWGAWLAASVLSILATLMLSAATLGFAAVILVPFFYIMVSGYSILVFGSVFVAPFRVAGWTLTEDTSLSALFE